MFVYVFFWVFLLKIDFIDILAGDMGEEEMAIIEDLDVELFCAGQRPYFSTSSHIFGSIHSFWTAKHTLASSEFGLLKHTHIHTHIYIYTYRHMYVHIYICIYICIYIYVLFIYTRTYIYTHIYIHIHIYVYIYIFAYSYMHAHIYIYMHILTCAHTHIYINTYICIYINK